MNNLSLDLPIFLECGVTFCNCSTTLIRHLIRDSPAWDLHLQDSWFLQPGKRRYQEPGHQHQTLPSIFSTRRCGNSHCKHSEAHARYCT